MKNFFCPFIDLYAAMKKLAVKRRGSSGVREAVIAVSVGIILYYTGWLLICLDWIPVAKGGYISHGVWNGTYNIIEQNISTRYGHFRAYSNEWVSGAVVQKNAEFWPENMENIAVGDRRGASNQLAVFGWLLIFCFITFVMTVKTSTREVLTIAGNGFDDFFGSFFLWPTVLAQVNEVLDDGPLKRNVEKVDAEKRACAVAEIAQPLQTQVDL